MKREGARGFGWRHEARKLGNQATVDMCRIAKKLNSEMCQNQNWSSTNTQENNLDGGEILMRKGEIIKLFESKDVGF